MDNLVALARKRPNPAPVIVINVFLGWTLVGWVVGLAMAFHAPQAAPTRPVPGQPV